MEPGCSIGTPAFSFVVEGITAMTPEQWQVCLDFMEYISFLMGMFIGIGYARMVCVGKNQTQFK